MKGKGMTAAAIFIRLMGILAVAVGVSGLLGLIGLAPLLQGFLVIAATKIVVDIALLLIKGKEPKYLFFEDYLRELFLFLAVAGICVLGVAVISRYVGGKIWFPLLATAAVMIWR